MLNSYNDTSRIAGTLAAACILAAAGGHALAVQPADLLGLWTTPGGNVVYIDTNHHGQLQGRLAIVAVDNRSAGFEVGQMVLTGFDLSGGGLKFEIAARPTGAPTDAGGCPPPDWLPFTGTMSADKRSMQGTVRTPEFDLTVSGGGTCSRVNEVDVRLPPYVRFSFQDPEAIPDRQVFALERQGPEVITFEASTDFPEGIKDRGGAPRVRLRTIDGEVVPNAEVRWVLTPADPQSTQSSREYVTETDGEGIAALRFTLLPNGQYVAVNQTRQPVAPARLDRGQWSISATAPELGLSQPVSFRATIDGPRALLNFKEVVGDTRPVRQTIVPTGATSHNVNIEIVDLERSGAGSVEVTLTSMALDYPANQSADGVWPAERNPFRHTLCRVPRSTRSAQIYESNPPLTLSVSPLNLPSSDDIPRNCRLHIPQGTGVVMVRAIMSSPRLQVNDLRVYLSDQFAKDRQLRMYFHDAYRKLGDLLTEAKGVPAEQRQLILQKRGYIERAFLLLNDPLDNSGPINNRTQMFAANAYVDLLTASRPQEERARNALLLNAPISNDTYSFPVRTLAESQALVRASKMAMDVRRMNFGGLLYVPTLGELRAGLDEVLTSPLQMAYVIAYGETWDGQRQDAVERLLLGLDVATYRLNTPRWMRHADDLFERQRRNRIARQHVRDARSAGIDVSMDEAFEVDRSRRRMRRSSREVPDEAAREIEERMEKLLIQPTWGDRSIPASLRANLRQVMTRIANSRSGRNLADALERLERVIDALPPGQRPSARGRLAMRIGAMEHWVKWQNEAAFWRHLVQQGQAREVQRWHRYASRDGRTEVFMEFSITDERKRRHRVDYAIARHFPDRIELHIVDLTGQLEVDHRAKTDGYAALFRQLLAKEHPGKPVVARATELYWRETNVEPRLDRLVREMALLR